MLRSSPPECPACGFTDSPVVTLLTDFGLSDHYVAAMKGVLLSHCSTVRLIDVTHQIPPQSVSTAALILNHTWPWFPAGTVHLVVVDPGVGTERKGLVVRHSNHCFVGPDNGVFSSILTAKDSEAYELSSSITTDGEVCSTFHGRDVFAPAVGKLISGRSKEVFGPICADPVLLDADDGICRIKEATYRGEVVYTDHFGNLVTNLTADLVATPGCSWVARLPDDSVWPVRRVYADVAPQTRVALVGSFGLLELAVNGGSAASLSGAGPGTPVILEPGG